MSGCRAWPAQNQDNAVTFSRSPLEIYPNGFASDTLAITLSANGSTRTIRMTRTGLVRIQ